MPPDPLNIDDMEQRHIGVSAGIAEGYHEAARVCLDRHHTSPHEFTVVDNDVERLATITWQQTDQRLRNAWGNRDDTTEAGAYCLALASAELTRGLVAVRRANTKSGVDYYLGPPGSTPEDLEESMRLEVSGTDEGTVGMVNTRLRQKMDQASRGDNNLPALATVVGFKVSRIVSAEVEQE